MENWRLKFVRDAHVLMGKPRDVTLVLDEIRAGFDELYGHGSFLDWETSYWAFDCMEWDEIHQALNNRSEAPIKRNTINARAYRGRKYILERIKTKYQKSDGTR